MTNPTNISASVGYASVAVSLGGVADAVVVQVSGLSLARGRAGFEASLALQLADGSTVSATDVAGRSLSVPVAIGSILFGVSNASVCDVFQFVQLNATSITSCVSGSALGDAAAAGLLPVHFPATLSEISNALGLNVSAASVTAAAGAAIDLDATAAITGLPYSLDVSLGATSAAVGVGSAPLLGRLGRLYQLDRDAAGGCRPFRRPLRHSAVAFGHPAGGRRFPCAISALSKFSIDLSLAGLPAVTLDLGFPVDIQIPFAAAQRNGITASRTQATMDNQNVVNYRPSFDAATHVGSDVVNSCLAAFRSGKASFDFTYSYSADPGVVADIVRPTASANPPPAAAAQPTSAEALYKPTVDVASRSATLKATVRDVDTCRPLGSKALARDATGLAGLPAEDEVNCSMVSSCAAAFLMGRQSFDFDYTFKVSSKADGDKKIVRPTPSPASMVNTAPTAAAEANAASVDELYKPIVDVESRSASLKATTNTFALAPKSNAAKSNAANSKSQAAAMPKFGASVDKDTHVGMFHGTAGSTADCKSLGSQMNCVSNFGTLSDKFNFAVNIQGPSASDLAPEGMTFASYLDPSKANVQTATINGVEFRALRDDGVGRASMRAVATTVDDCSTIAGIPTSEKTNDGFCDVFQGADRDNCIELFNTRVDDCEASVGDTGKAFEFYLSYASSKPLTPSGKSVVATKSDKAPASPASASAAVGERTFGDKNTKTITKVVGNEMSVTASYVPSLNRAAIKSTVTSSKDCDALAALASTDDESGFCDAHKDCTTGFKCRAAFADKDTKSYDFLFVFGGKPGDTSVTEGDKSDTKKASVFGIKKTSSNKKSDDSSAAKSKKTDGKPALASSELGNSADTTKTTKIVGDDVSVSASYVHSLNRAAVKATAGSAEDCDADCMAGFAAAAGKCKAAFKDSGADKYDFSFVFGGVAKKDQTVPASAQATSDRKEEGVLDALVKVDDKLLASVADPAAAPEAAESPKAESATSKSTTLGSLDKVEFQRDGAEFTALRDREVSQAGLKATLEGDAQCETAAGVATEFCSAFTGEEDCVEHFTKYTADCSQFFDSASKSAQSLNFMFAYAGTLAAGTPGFLASASAGNNGVAKYSASWARVPEVPRSSSSDRLGSFSFGKSASDAIQTSEDALLPLGVGATVSFFIGHPIDLATAVRDLLVGTLDVGDGEEGDGSTRLSLGNSGALTLDVLDVGFLPSSLISATVSAGLQWVWSVGANLPFVGVVINLDGVSAVDVAVWGLALAGGNDTSAVHALSLAADRALVATVFDDFFDGSAFPGDLIVGNLALGTSDSDYISLGHPRR
ncbi:hypothetical protein HK405_001848, partial [Cladochytrium tenue]